MDSGLMAVSSLSLSTLLETPLLVLLVGQGCVSLEAVWLGFPCELGHHVSDALAEGAFLGLGWQLGSFAGWSRPPQL